MTLNDYCEHIRNPLSEAKARVVLVPPGECWTALHLFYQERGGVEVRLSDLVQESAWLPMPDEVFERVRDTIDALSVSGKSVVLLGLPGYLALLTDENKRALIATLREWVDGTSGRDAVCFLRSDDGTGLILKEVFANPRYRQAKKLIEIDAEKGEPQFAPLWSPRLTVATEEVEGSSGRTEIRLVGDNLISFIPDACDTFQKYLRYTEEHPNDRSVRRIVVASEGRELAGLSAEVLQVVCMRDFARLFYGVDDAGLSEDTLRWMCGRGKDGAGKKLPETLKELFFPEVGVTKRVLAVFDARRGPEREAVLWLIKHIAAKGSYLECIAGQSGVSASNFRSAYVTGAIQFLDNSAEPAGERRTAIMEAGVKMSDANIRQFIASSVGESTERVAPWLNCGTAAERAELLRRCAVDGVVSKIVKSVYPEVAAYLNTAPVFEVEMLENYFTDYRELKIINGVTPEFYTRATQALPPGLIQSRNEMVQRYVGDSGCALLVVDAMGAEWLPMLVALAQQRDLGLVTVAVGKVQLPTSTQFNMIHWPDVVRRLADIKRFDNIAHYGAEKHETRRAEENLAAALDVIDREVLPSVAAGLAQFERVLVTADHGSSRLALLAWHSEPRLACTLDCEESANVADWRYRERAKHGGCPPELEETLDGKHWVVRGYDRLPKQGGGQGFELHGGATLEERLVPVVVFARTGQFIPAARTGGKRAQIVEKDDFDL